MVLNEDNLSIYFKNELRNVIKEKYTQYRLENSYDPTKFLNELFNIANDSSINDEQCYKKLISLFNTNGYKTDAEELCMIFKQLVKHFI